jgi:hypothetical protein
MRSRERVVQKTSRMAWVYDGSQGVLEYYNRRGERVQGTEVRCGAGSPGTLDLLFRVAEAPGLTDEDLGRLVRLLASRRKAGLTHAHGPRKRGGS